MSFSNWLSDAPSGVIAAWWGWIVALVLAVVFSTNFIADRLARHDFEADEIQCRTDQEAEYARRKSPIGGNQPTPEPNSDKDPKKIARDYCVQRRAAIAGETQAEIARLAAWVSYLAFGAGAIAVCAAVWAGNSARKTVNTMQETAALENRAWLAIEDVKIADAVLVDDEGISVGIDVKVKNIGRTPAKNVWVDARLTVIGGKKQSLPNDIMALRRSSAEKYRTRGRITIFPNETYTEEGIEVEAPAIDIDSVVSTLIPPAVPIALIVVGVTYTKLSDADPGETGRIYLVQHVNIRRKHAWGNAELERVKPTEEWTA